MADKDVSIHIKTAADTAGAKSAADALEEIGDEAKAAAEDTAALAKATDDVADAMRRREAAGGPSGGGGFGGQLDGTVARDEAAERLEDEVRLRREATEATAEQAAEEERLQAVQEARAEALGQAEEDLREIRQRQADEAAQEDVRERDRMVGRALAIAAAGAAIQQTFMEAVKQLKEVSTEAQEIGVEVPAMLTAITDTVDALISPVETIFNAISAPARDALEKLRESQKLAVELEKAFEAMKKARAAAAREAAADGIANVYRREKEEIEDATAALQNQMMVLESRRRLLEAQASLSDTQARLAGEDPDKIAAGAVMFREGKARERESARLELVERELEAARGDLAAKQDALRGAIDQFTVHSKEAEAAMDEARSASRLVENLEDEVKAVQAASDAAMGEISVKAQEEFSVLAGNVTDDMKDLADDAIEELEKAKDDAGGRLTILAQQQLDRLVQIVEDGLVKPNEFAALKQTLEMVGATQEAQDAAIFQTFQAMINRMAAAERKFVAMQKQIDDLGRRR